MFAKLAKINERFEEIEATLAVGNLSTKELTELAKEHSDISKVVEVYRDYQKAQRDLGQAQALCKESDPDLRALAKEDIDAILVRLKNLQDELVVLTLPKDPHDGRNILLEIRAGTGGEEAALFVQDLLRMYLRYADRQQSWRTEIMQSTLASSGGMKEVVVLMEGNNVYSYLKFEKGTHRVQRVPLTESQGRIHTSACTVAVLAEADDIDVHIRPEDLEIKVCRASGAGGQHVNTTDSAVRIEHKPSGLIAECQDERSQHKNKDKALKILKARLLEKMEKEQQATMSEDRKNQVGSGDRSERIRTYNFPQGRITDHRIQLTLYKLESIMDGDLTEIIQALQQNQQMRIMSKQ